MLLFHPGGWGNRSAGSTAGHESIYLSFLFFGLLLDRSVCASATASISCQFGNVERKRVNDSKSIDDYTFGADRSNNKETKP